MPTRKKTQHDTAGSNGAPAAEETTVVTTAERPADTGGDTPAANGAEEQSPVMAATGDQLPTPPESGDTPVPHWKDLGLTEDILREMYYYMVLARSLDERMWLLNRQGKAPFVISVQGHEAGQVGLAFAMERGKDWFVPYYRDLALLLVLGQTPRQVMLSLFSKREEPNSEIGRASCRDGVEG